MDPIAWGIVGGGLLIIAAWTWWAPWRRRRWLASRVALEDTLKLCYQATRDDRPITVEFLAGALRVMPSQAARLVERLERDGILGRQDGGLILTPDGMRMAASIVRAHRLLERFLADETAMPAAAVHTAAHQREHHISADEVERLDAYLGHPRIDPHGDPIPTREGTVSAPAATALLAWPVNEPAQIAHLEDEPEALYAQLLAQGLRPGLPVRVVARDAARVTLVVEDHEVELAPVVAAQVQVQALRDGPRMAGIPLSAAGYGMRYTVVALDPACQGTTRRRLLDLGITPGARIEVAMTSPFGDPTAYRVRDALLALRREQAAYIWVTAREGTT